MTLPEYQIEIAAAKNATKLHQLRTSVVADPELHSTEKDELCRAIGTLFNRLSIALSGKPNRTR